MAQVLDDREIDQRLGALSGWERSGDEISKTYEFDDFAGSLGFVNRVGEMAENADHHPDIDIRWNKVKLVLSTHSDGGLTEKDFNLATEIDGAGGDAN